MCMEPKAKMKITALSSGKTALMSTGATPSGNKDMAPRKYSTTARRMKPSTR